MSDRAPLSIIIPTLNCAESLGATAASLIEGVHDGLVRELIISDGGSQDSVRSVAAALGAKFVTGRPGRGAQLAAGANLSKGDWFLFLHADTHLEAGWSQIAREAMERSDDRAMCFRLKFRADGWLPSMVAGWANMRTRLFELPFGDQGLLIHRRLYLAVGGFSDIPLMEDVDIARRLRGCWRILAARAATSAGRYQARGWLRQGSTNLLLQAQYFCGFNPDWLSARYQSRHDARSKSHAGDSGRFIKGGR